MKQAINLEREPLKTYIDLSIVRGDQVPYMAKTQRLKSIFATNDFMVFLTTMFLFGVSIGLFAGVLNNFLAEILSIDRFGRGVVEFARELPGLCLILILSLMYRKAETYIIRVALVVSATGVMGLLFLGERLIPAIFLIVLWSAGEHILMPVRQSIAIHSAHPGKEGRAMGITGSFGHVGMVTGFYAVPAVFFLVKRFVPINEQAGSIAPFKAVFLFSLLFALGGVLFSLRFQKSAHHIRKERLYVKRKYWRYYVLEMFFGARKQVFFTFAPFVLILNYGAKTELIAMLYGIYSTLNIFLHPLIGKLIDRVGYRIILVCDAVLLVTICLLYGFSHHLFPKNIALVVVCVIFVLDGTLFVVGMARSLYAKSINSNKRELTATLSTGISVNHVMSIAIALLGGLLWQRLGIELLFIFAACFGAGAFMFSWFLPRPR